MRVVADHVRATTFLIGDGVIPSNEWRGYVLRKIMRRAMRHGKRLGLREPFLHRLVDVVVAEMGQAYPDLPGSRDAVVNVVKGEEERFDAVLTAGLPRLEDLLDRAAASPGKRVPGDEVFRLYDSLGVPVDFIEDLASERQLTLDREGYERAMEGQRERARAGSTFDQKKAAGFTFASDAARTTLEQTPDRFVGYDATRHRRRHRRRALRRGAGAGRGARRRRAGLRRHRSHAVLSRSRRPGVRHRHDVRRRPARPRWTASCASSRADRARTASP